MTEDLTLITVTKQCPLCQGIFGARSAVCPSDGTLLMPIRKDDLLGSLFADKYRVVEEIGRGGMSVVYKGFHELMRRQVAIKIMQRELSEDAVSVRRFQQESEAASRLSHPHVITIYDFGVTPTAQPYMVLDLIKGTTFSEVIKETKRLEPERVLHIFDQICDALEHAHQRGVVHRDLKPSNIMLISTETEEDYVKVLDFGIAKVMVQPGEKALGLTTTGEVFGSPLYMSPEQCQAAPSDQRTDVYAIGIMLYEAFTGQTPFCGANFIETLQMQIFQPPASFSEAYPGNKIPASLERIALKAIEKRPEDRYQSVHELRSDLRVARDQLNATSSKLPQTALKEEPGAPIRNTVATSGQGIGSPKILIVASSLLALCAIGYFAFSQTSANRQPADGENQIGPLETSNGTIFYYNPESTPGVLVLNTNDGAMKLLTGKVKLENLLKASDRKVLNGDIWNCGFRRNSTRAYLDEKGSSFTDKIDSDIYAVDTLIRNHYSNLANGKFAEAYDDLSDLFVQKFMSRDAAVKNWKKTWRGIKGCENAPVSAIRFLSQNENGIEVRVDASKFVLGETKDYHIQFIKEKPKQSGKHAAHWKFLSLSLDDKSKNDGSH